MAVDRDKVSRNALRFIQKGQFQKAIAEYEKLLSLDPRDIRTRLKLVDLYGRAGRKKEAIDECLEVADAYADQGFFLKAIAVYKQALRIDPESPFLYQNMGEMYMKQGLVGDALGSYKRGVEVLRQLGRGGEAEELLVRMEEMAPENAAIKIHLAELYIDEGRFEDFEELLSKLILQLRGEGRSRKLLQAVESFYEKSERHLAVLNRLAELYVELGEEEKALEVIREGLARRPGDRDLRLLALRAHLLTGQLLDARRMAWALCEEDPEDLHILEQVASIAQARGDRTELADAYRAMAKVYGRRGLPQKEEQYYRKVTGIIPDDAEARLALGEMVVDLGRDEPSAVPHEDAGEWEGPGPAEAAGDEAVHDGLLEADLYLKYGMEEKAAEKLAQLTELAPDDIQIRTKLRDLCQRKGDRGGWIREQLHIAELFLRDRRESEALRAYGAIVEVDPENAEARKGIQYLRPDVVQSRAGDVEVDVDGSTIEFVEQEGMEQVIRVRSEREPAEDADEEQLRQGLAEADFYEAQELNDEAVKVLLRLREKYPSSPHLAVRLERLGLAGPSGEPGDVQAANADEDFVDLQAEILDAADISLGGDFAGFQDFEVSELDDIVREFKSGIAERLDAEDFETHYNLGVAYREMGLYDDAIEEFQVAARSPEKARDSYTSMAQVFRDLERHNDAQAALRMALAVPGNGPEDRVAILYEMGTLAEKQEDWESACSCFQKAADVDPSHRDLQKRLQRVRGLLGD